MWCLTSGKELVFRAWDAEDLAVCFQAKTGDTHLIETSSLEILEWVTAEPSSVGQLAEKMAGRFVGEDSGQIEEFISTTLLKLQDLGLVTNTPV